MLPDSMRAPALGSTDVVPRFEAKLDCPGCGYDAASAAKAAQSGGLPNDARNVTED
jgi:hypothetical protein